MESGYFSPLMILNGTNEPMGVYWTTYAGSEGYSNILIFSYGIFNFVSVGADGWSVRYLGFSVRPVRNNN